MNDSAPVIQSDPETMRRKIIALEKKILSQEQIELETIHHFSKGVYARELRIPAGVVLTGKIHRYESLNILAKGKISIATEDGMKTIEAPSVVVSPPGTKRAGHALEDTVWITIHGTDEKDVELIENEVIVESFEQLEIENEKKVKLCHGQQQQAPQ